MLASIIACSIVIVIISTVTEFRVNKLELYNLKLTDEINRKNDTIIELARLADELVDKGETMLEVLEDNFTDDEINEMIAYKKKEKEPKDINELIKQIKENENEHE